MFDIVLLALSIPCFIRNKVAPIMLMILCLFYAGSIIGEGMGTFPFVHNYRDSGIFLYFLLLCNLSLRSKKGYEGRDIRLIKKGILVFFLFLFLSYIVDLCINHVALSSIFKSMRDWSVLLFIWIVPKLRNTEIYSFIRMLFVFTFILTILFIVESLFNISITGAVRVTENVGSRATIPWPLSLFVWGIVLSGALKVPNSWKIIYIAVVVLHLIICGSRSHFIAFALVLLMFFFLKGTINIKKVMVSIFALIAMVVIFSTDNMLSERFSESRQELSDMHSGSKEVEGNFSFRILLLEERMAYINQNIQYTIFGIGNVQERDLRRNLFSIGLINEDNEVAQLDTGDIAWPLLLLRLGYVGTMIYLCFIYFRGMAIGWNNRKNPLALTLFVYLFIHLFFASFTDYVISNSLFWFVPFVSIILVEREKIERRNYCLVGSD